MDQKIHAEFSCSVVTMSKKIHGKFSIFDGYCHGYNIELIKGKKIVQVDFLDILIPRQFQNKILFAGRKRRATVGKKKLSGNTMLINFVHHFKSTGYKEPEF